MLRLAPDEKVSEVLPVRHFIEGKYVAVITRRGLIKRVDLMAFANVRSGGILAVSLEDDDELIAALLTEGKSDLIISTRDGMAIRFGEEDVRAMGRAARGVRAISLEEGDWVVNAVSVPAEALAQEQGEALQAEQPTLLTVCERGFGKRTLLGEYRCQGRGGKGVIDIKTTERNGHVIGTCLVSAEDDVMLITTGGNIIRTKVGEISIIGRNTMGVGLVKVGEEESVAAVVRLAEDGEEEGEDGGAGEPGDGAPPVNGQANPAAIDEEGQ
jgi:DNA gyrase subunit A